MTDSWVDAPQLSRDERVILVGIGLVLPVAMILLFVFLVGSLATTIGVLVTALVPAIAAITAVVAVGRLHVSRLGLHDGAVEIVTWFGHSEVPWSELWLGPQAASASFVSLLVRKRGAAWSGSYLLSALQAQSLASDPRFGGGSRRGSEALPEPAVR